MLIPNENLIPSDEIDEQAASVGASSLTNLLLVFPIKRQLKRLAETRPGPNCPLRPF